MNIFGLSPTAAELGATVGALVAGGWALVTFVVGERRSNNDWILQLFTQLDQIGTAIRAEPALQMYFSESIHREPQEFKESGGVPRDDGFYKAKTLVYSNLNVFDSFAARTMPGGRRTRLTELRRLILFPNSAEMHNWDAYMIQRLRHPFFRAVVEEEREIFGNSLCRFYELNVKDTANKPLKYLW